MRVSLSLAVLFVFAAGCGSRPKPSGKAPAEHDRPVAALNPGAGPALAPANPDDKRPVLVAFGDSLTAGYGADAGQSYPDFMQKMLDEEHYPWRVVNAGISGETTAEALERVGTILPLKPRIVVVELGGNDGLRGLPLSATEANLEQIVATLKKAGAQVALAGMTLPPNYGPDYIRHFENIYRMLAAKYKVTLISSLFEGLITPDGRYFQRDGIHPTAPGYRIMAGNVFRAVKPLLK